MMIKVLVFATLAVSILPNARSQQQPHSAAQIVKFSSSPNSGNGEYSFEYELSDGTYRQENSTLQKAGTPDEYIVVQGVYRWISPDGVRWETRYSADDTGYHASKVITRYPPVYLAKPLPAVQQIPMFPKAVVAYDLPATTKQPQLQSSISDSLAYALVGGG